MSFRPTVLRSAPSIERETMNLEEWHVTDSQPPSVTRIVEAMDLNEDGLIQRHCVYWGWFGFGVLQRNEYNR